MGGGGMGGGGGNYGNKPRGMGGPGGSGGGSGPDRRNMDYPEPQPPAGKNQFYPTIFKLSMSKSEEN